MSRHTVLNVSFSPENVKQLHENAIAGLPAGAHVISDAVTDRVFSWLPSVTYDDICRAGVTGMGPAEGVMRNYPGLYISDGYSGKLSGKVPAGSVTAAGEKINFDTVLAAMVGISGYAGNNYTCLYRALCGGICAKCFSLLTPWKPSIKAWTRNDVILSSIEITHNDVLLDPVLIPFLRYSSHGDLINGLHAKNYLQIAADNEDTNFTLWTKNAHFYREGLRMYGKPKPDNLTVIYSPLNMNCVPSYTSLQRMKEAGYDAVFSVFQDREKQAKAVAAGAHFCACGDGSCRHLCQFCYNPALRASYDAGAAILIAEILDGEKHRE